MIKIKKSIFILFSSMLGFAGCTGIPENVVPVGNFNLSKYLGTWYEIARIDHSFESGLTKVTAQYNVRDDGGVQVLNKGYNAEKHEWKTAEGKAYFVDTPDKAYLKVSFFGPFFASYIVFALDTLQYQYALVSVRINRTCGFFRVHRQWRNKSATALLPKPRRSVLKRTK